MGPTEKIFPSAMTSYLLLTHGAGDVGIASAKRFKSMHEGLDKDPYGDKVGFAVGSNQSIINEEDAPIWVRRMADEDERGKKDWQALLKDIRRKSEERIRTKASTKVAKTMFEAIVSWENHGDVLCPGCENHVHEDEAEEYAGDVWHITCANEERRINASDDAMERAYDPQEELPSERVASKRRVISDDFQIDIKS